MYNLDKFSKVKVLVIGDVMIDKYLWGDVSRISPEAPVPVVQLKRTSLVAGGAANVAANIAGLGATAYLIGVIGDDVEGKAFIDLLRKQSAASEYMVISGNRPTTVKTRIIAHNQQIARLDYETTETLGAEEEELVWRNFQKIAPAIDVIVISDYAKGVLSVALLARLIKYGADHNKLILVDPKGRDYSKYKNATLITPNKFEVAEVCGGRVHDAETLIAAGQKLLAELSLKAVIITRGEEGITLIERGEAPQSLSAFSRKVYDVTGAGDTFISALAVAIGAGNNFITSSMIANTAAGLAVEVVGTTSISFNHLYASIKESN